MINSVSYRSTHKESIVNLLGNKPYKMKIWEWQFCQNAFGIEFDPIVMVQDGKTVGFNGVMPVYVRSGGRDLLALWSCDFYVDKIMRGKGVGKKIKDELHKKSGLIMAFGISPMAERVLQKMGWARNTEIYSYSRYTQFNSLRRGLQLGVQSINRFRGSLLTEQGLYSDYQFKISATLPDKGEVEALWEAVRDGYDKIVCRNYSYLDWRYQNHPSASYKYLSIHCRSKLLALLVYRERAQSLLIVDYLGASGEYQFKKHVIRYFLTKEAKENEVHVSTSDPDLGRAFLGNGFFRLRLQPRFYVYSGLTGVSGQEAGWFVMPGDSDGELLVAAQDAYSDIHAKKDDRDVSLDAGAEIKVDRLDEADFAEFRHEWDDLLKCSDADRLFMSWPWLFSWWRTWSSSLSAELLLLTVRCNGRLVGLAPFYVSTTRGVFGLSIKRIHVIGNAWKIMPTVRSEYMGLIAESGLEEKVLQSVLEYLQQYKWNDLVICDVELEYLRRCSAVIKEQKLAIIELRDDKGVVIDVGKQFPGWVSSLGRNTRKKLLNDRRIIIIQADMETCEANKSEWAYYFDKLNELHEARWGEACFSGLSEEFHRYLFSISEPSLKVRLSGLKLNGNIQSVLYDIQAGEKIYNLQSGFNDSYSKKLSLGTMHLGYAIERSFGDPHIKWYDLLAGAGKNSFYKDRFKGEAVSFRTIILVRHPLMKVMYSGYNSLPKIIQKLIYNFLLRKIW